MNSEAEGVNWAFIFNLPLWYGLAAALVAYWIYQLLNQCDRGGRSAEDCELDRLQRRYQEIMDLRRARREKEDRERAAREFDRTGL